MFHKNSIFCGVDTVASLTGHTPEQIHERVDEGAWLWVWNVSAGTSEKRELRFWSRELENPGAVMDLSLDKVLGQVIPNRSKIIGQFDGLRQWEFTNLMRMDRKRISELSEELKMFKNDHGVCIPRVALEQFFRTRWCGNVTTPRQSALKI